MTLAEIVIETPKTLGDWWPVLPITAGLIGYAILRAISRRGRR